MNEAKQLDENGDEPRPELNPLYVSDSSITNYNSPVIEASQTIFSRALKIVKDGIEKCKRDPNCYE